jgi:hypothetical protein
LAGTEQDHDAEVGFPSRVTGVYQKVLERLLRDLHAEEPLLLGFQHKLNLENRSMVPGTLAS